LTKENEMQITEEKTKASEVHDRRLPKNESIQMGPYFKY
jgi:hypothetical protein